MIQAKTWIMKEPQCWWFWNRGQASVLGIQAGLESPYFLAMPIRSNEV